MARAAIERALAGSGAAIVIADLDDTPAIVVARVHAAAGAMVLLVVAEAVPPLARAMLLAAVGPLAIELAPAQRIAALDLAPGALLADIAAAATFLTGARSTTGQVLRIG